MSAVQSASTWLGRLRGVRRVAAAEIHPRHFFVGAGAQPSLLFATRTAPPPSAATAGGSAPQFPYTHPSDAERGVQWVLQVDVGAGKAAAAVHRPPHSSGRSDTRPAPVVVDIRPGWREGAEVHASEEGVATVECDAVSETLRVTVAHREAVASTLAMAAGVSVLLPVQMDVCVCDTDPVVAPAATAVSKGHRSVVHSAPVPRVPIHVSIADKLEGYCVIDLSKPTTSASVILELAGGTTAANTSSSSSNGSSTNVSLHYPGDVGHVITANKVRGELITLKSDGGGSVSVSGVVESRRADIAGGTVFIQKLLSDVAAIAVSRGPLTLHSAYVRDLNIVSSGYHGHVNIDTLHGAASIRMEPESVGDITIGGLTGGVHVSAASTVTLHIDSLRGNSVIQTEGDIIISMVAPVACHLALACACGITLMPGLTGLFREGKPNVALLPPASQHIFPQMALQPWNIQGILTVSQDAPPLSALEYDPENPTAKLDAWRQDKKSNASGSGKISSDVPTTGFYSSPSSSSSRTTTSSGGTEDGSMPSLVLLSSQGNIKLEVISWYENVQRGVSRRAGKPTTGKFSNN